MEKARASVMRPSELVDVDGKMQTVQGYDFNAGVNYDALLVSMARTGFQATHLADAIATVNHMITGDSECKIFFGFDANHMSSGLRETIRFLVEHHMVHVLVTTAGGIEQDLVKGLGEFPLPKDTVDNDVGSLVTTYDRYKKLQQWILPILDELVTEQKEEGINWTPSKVIARLGKQINNTGSVCYWAQQNGIPIYCPALTDGFLGNMMASRNDFMIDIVEDIVGINQEAQRAGHKTGMIILGGGIPKHHICNANLMRNGADYAVFINTAQEFDGSDSGARPDEAISWGKIRGDSRPVKLAQVHCDATIAFPLLVAETFAKLKSL